MSYCLNPSCSQPNNSPSAQFCKACHEKLKALDRYRAIKSLGKGGFGATFLAIDELLPGKPICVIKQLRPVFETQSFFQMAKELFQREAETLGRIGNHPQIPRLLDYFEDGQRFYLVQAYVSGQNLYQEVKQNGPYTEAGAKQFLSEILPILKYIHSQNTIHRDIKPANIIRRLEDRQLVLIDFGAVKNRFHLPTHGNNSGETAFTSFSIGTAGFAPPEQIAMRPVYASDIYATGATCLYLLTGKFPKDMETDSVSGEIMWRKYVNVSDNFARVLATMLEPSVAHRYKNTDEVLKDLEVIPYFESLSRGLIRQPNSSGKGTGNIPAREARDSPKYQLSDEAAAKLSQAMRSRRSRASRAGTSSDSNFKGNSPPPNLKESRLDSAILTNNRSRKNSKKIVGQKLNAETLIANYSRGERDFLEQDLNSLNLRKANLSGGMFHQSQLQKVDLIESNLSNANFARANLSQALLQKANLTKAYLGYADLKGADLRGADLSFAHLYYANLKGANLCGANLSNAKIGEAQLAQAKLNWMTIMPNGKRKFWSSI